MQAMPLPSPTNSNRDVTAREHESLIDDATPAKVDIMVALMAALSSPDDYVIVERDGELYIEPLQ